MQFLKILFWCLLVFVAAVFTFGNWTTVPIKLWGGLVAEVNLPLLLFVTFLAGMVPTMLYYHAVRWRLRNRLVSAERTVSDLRGALIAPPPPPAAAELPEPSIEPPSFAPMVPPPVEPTLFPPSTT